MQLRFLADNVGCESTAQRSEAKLVGEKSLHQHRATCLTALQVIRKRHIISQNNFATGLTKATASLPNMTRSWKTDRTFMLRARHPWAGGGTNALTLAP